MKSFYVFKKGVNPKLNQSKKLKDGTVIKGGYEVAYNSQTFGKSALIYAEMTAKRIDGVVYTKDNEGKYVQVKRSHIANTWYKYHNNNNKKVA